MDSQALKLAIEEFHQWRRALLLSGHNAAGENQPDPQLVLSSKMLKVFLTLHPKHHPLMTQLQVHFLDEDYTNRVRPVEWMQILRKVDELC